MALDALRNRGARTALAIAGRLPARWVAALERAVRRIPAVRARLRLELEPLVQELAPSVKPYRGRLPDVSRLPAEGRPREELLAAIDALTAEEAPRWRDGRVSGAVYHGDPEHAAFLAEVYAKHLQTNPLHADVWPSIAKFEVEIVAMTAALLGGDPAEPRRDRRVVGAVTSGGTESILLAMKAYRDRARARGLERPEIVAPTTAHVAFDKASQLFDMPIRRVPVGADGAGDPRAMRRAVTRRTAVLVASAPAFPHGLVDPVPALAELAARRGIGLHVDACLGGFVLPFARKLGYAVPPFDFSVPGVTSMSADTHKYGYAPKGTSVVLYRGADLRAYQWFTSTDWPGGLYLSPTLAGSRPGALSAAAWAAMLSLGERGYLEATRRILEAAARMKEAIRAVPGLRLVGDPLFVVAFTSETLDVYRVLEGMSRRGWSLNGLQRPPAVHLAVTLRHAQPGVVERFRTDLAAATEEARAAPAAEGGGMAPVYGLAGRLPLRGVVDDMLRAYLDMLYDP
ncbi:MAG TPA: aminotransferase class V-fold PLP-dependent enzyme [Anaeromyxobacter sp.]|nr:aminotransferase class V-fold PLP-dependent enzyme [Anaeromyxobacter sp.]